MLRRLAEIISVAGHPLALLAVLFGFAASSRVRARSATALIVAIGLLAIGPALLFLRRKVRSGQWKDSDASHRNERTELLRGSLLIAGTTAILLLAAPGLRKLADGAIAALMIFVVAAIANRWLRISLHVAFATFVAIGLSAFVRAEAAPLFVALPIAVTWARLELRRHTVTEVVLGAILGFLAGAWLRFM